MTPDTVSGNIRARPGQGAERKEGNVENIGRNEAKAISADVQQALAAVAEKHGVAFKLGRGTFDGLTFNLKVEFTAQRADGATRESEDFKRYADMYGFEADDLGKVVTINRKDYRIVGLLTKRTKYNVLVEPVTGGKAVLFPHDAVLRCMGRTDPYAIPTITIDAGAK